MVTTSSTSPRPDPAPELHRGPRRPSSPGFGTCTRATPRDGRRRRHLAVVHRSSRYRYRCRRGRPLHHPSSWQIVPAVRGASTRSSCCTPPADGGVPAPVLYAARAAASRTWRRPAPRPWRAGLRRRYPRIDRIVTGNAYVAEASARSPRRHRRSRHPCQANEVVRAQRGTARFVALDLIARPAPTRARTFFVTRWDPTWWSRWRLRTATAVRTPRHP